MKLRHRRNRHTERKTNARRCFPSIEQLENRLLLAVDTPDAFEPNNTFETAFDVGTTDNFFPQLTIHEANNDDWYKWTASQNGFLRVDAAFVHDDGDIDIEIHDESNKRIARSDSLSDNESILLEVQAGRMYWIRVRGFLGAINFYDLLIDGPAIPFPEDALEPDDDFDQANDIGTNDQTFTDLSIHASFNSDVFRYTSPAAGTLVVDLFFDHDEANLDLELYDSDENLIATSASDDDNEQIIQQVAEDDVFFVRVFGRFGSTIENYSLGINGPAVFPDALEPNNTPLQASNIGLGDQAINDLTLHDELDEDWLTWIASAPGDLTVDINFLHGLGDVDIEVRDIGQNILVSGVTETDNEQVMLPVVAGQQLFFRIFGKNGELQQNYDVVVDGPELDADRFEPNDLFAEPTDVGFGDSELPGLSIHEPFNDDYFKWTAPQDGTLQVWAFFSDFFGNVDLDLLDQSGNLIARSDSTSDNEHVTVPVEAGKKYVIRVYSPNGELNGSYDLVIDGPEQIPDQFEPNDTFGDATDLGKGDQSHTDLSVLDAFGNDFYKWTPDADGEVSIDVLHRASLGNLDLQVFRADDGSFVANASTFTDNEHLTIPVTQGEMIIIEVYAFGTDAPRRYDLRIDGPTEVPDALETNDTIQTASDVGVGDQSVTDLSLHNENDEDFLKWTATNTGKVTVDVSFVHALGNIDVQLLNMNGIVIDQSASVSDDETLTFFADAGEMFFVRILSPGGDVQLNYDVSIDANDPAVVDAIPDQPDGVEDTPIGPIVINAEDPDSPKSQWSFTANSSNSLVVSNSGISIQETVLDGDEAKFAITITPNPNQAGTTSITIGLNDGDGAVTEQTFDATFAPVNDAPFVSGPADDVVVDEDADDTIIDLNNVFRDPDVGDTLTFSISSANGPPLLDASITNSLLVLDYQENQSGDTKVVVRATDEAGLFAEDTVSVFVAPVNDLPTITTIDDVQTDEDVATDPIAFTVSDIETPAGDLNVSADAANDELVADIQIEQVSADGQANYVAVITPVENQTGSTDVTISVEDADGGISAETFLLTISGVNDLPTLSEIPDQVTDEDTPTLPIPFVVSDVESDGATLTVSATSSDSTVIADNGIVIEEAAPDGETAYTIQLFPLENAFGSTEITVLVEDSGGASDTESFNVTVNSVNDAPTIVSPIGPLVVDEDADDSVFDLNNVFGDVDIATSGDSLAFSLRSNDNPALVVVTRSNGILTFDYQDNQHGTAEVVVRATDTGGQFVQETIQLTVNSVNDGPTVSVPGAVQEIDENTSLTFSAAGGNAISVADVDAGAADVVANISVDDGILTLGDTSGLTSVGGNGSSAVTLTGTVGAINNALNGLEYTPVADFFGSDTLTVSVNDQGAAGSGGAQSADASATINVIGEENAVPVITSGTPVLVTEGDTAVAQLTATDADNDPITYGISGGADQALLAINSLTGSLVFFAAPDFDSPADADGDNIYEIVVTASDGNGGVAQQPLEIIVTKLDDAPPTVEIVAVSPDPRAGGVSEITVVFSESVSGVDLGDFALTRKTDDVTSLLPGEATLSTSDNVTYTIGNLVGLTGPAGIYSIVLNASGSGILDSVNNPLVSGAQDSWINGAGDANQDNQFDQFDIIAILQGGKYRSGQPATWSQGDWNGDGFFDQFDLLTAQQTSPAHYQQGPFAATGGRSGSNGDDSTDAVFEELGG